jgi:lipopolysaccharide transport system permease protein
VVYHTACAMQNHTVIKPRRGWRVVDVAELVRYRDLFKLLVLRDLRVLYKQTALGFGWAVLRPMLTMIIFSVVFGRLASMPSDGVPYPLFAMAAVVPWTYFATAIGKATSSLVSSTGMLSKIYFPRLLIPLTPVVAGLVDFAIASVLLGVMMAWFGVVPGTQIVFVPLLVLVMVCTAAGLGMWFAALAIQYRDVNQAMPFIVQLLMFAAPVVWPSSLIISKFPEHESIVRMLYGLYPMAGVVEGFRSALLDTMPMPWDLLVTGTASALFLLVTGALYFRRVERVFADVA